ncbi:hypothetical protein CCAX7_004750 [Capsulimonas corticalis]|uniref:Uncharacterized protein n=1 Tax=Capsulimonas corticalis TaxID=2219043 RepID=A0A402D2Q4_9BACT|nr:hypothetical protein [Capsulimonas corticalis]BDI28424.1 hypothetical protein CCAX7_004750 [Capsulimonas corticalis]
MATHKERPTHCRTSASHHDDAGSALPASADGSAMMSAGWEMDPSEQIIAALRSYFLTHTLDFLTGEVYTVH